MRFYCTLLLTLYTCFCNCLSANAAIFTVTSNADAGPGTLRDAIEQANANGNATMDLIQFNFADQSISGRTIIIQSSFPDLSSNITIDGSTQAGTKIGVSDARVAITNPTGVGVEYVFRVLVNGNINIYGLHVHDLNGTLNSVVGSAQVLQLFKAYNINVGAPGKGNYFTNVAVVICYTYWPQTPGRGIVENLSFKSNVVNLSEDGQTIKPQSWAIVMSLGNVRNLDIGGELPGEGNYISSINEWTVSVYTDTFANINTGYIKVLNNKLGCNYEGTKSLTCGYFSFVNGSNYNYTDTSQVIVKGNIFEANYYALPSYGRPFLVVRDKKGFIDIKSNRVGVVQNAIGFPNLTTVAFGISGCEDGIIGGDNPGDSNFIASCNTAIGLGNNKNIKITKNSIFCNSKGIAASSSITDIPYTTISVITGNLVQGKTLPNSIVEVFITKQCAYCNNGKTYLGNTTADASGDWSFTSTGLLDGAITATGTSPSGATGEFARPEFINNLDIKNPTCGKNNGFIHGMQFVSGTKYYWVAWVNGVTDTLYTLNLDNLKEGIYTFVVEQGNYCSVRDVRYLSNNPPKIIAGGKAIIQPSCGKNNGSITGVYASGEWVQRYWKDEYNNIISTDQELYDVGPGKYKMVALGAEGACGDSSEFFVLTNQSGPSMNTVPAVVSAATCGKNNGSVNGITVANITSPAVYVWVDEGNNIVGNTADLTGMRPGKYRLKFKDGGGCDTLFTSFFDIGSVGVITMDLTQMTTTSSPCGASTGSIHNIQSTGATIFKWYNAAGNLVGSTPDLNNMPGGKYVLKFSNTQGCSLETDSITIGVQPFINVSVLQSQSVSGTCDKKNGYFQYTNLPNATSYTYQWVETSQPLQVIGASLKLDNINSGTFALTVKNAAGCIQQLPQISLPYLKPVSIVEGNASVVNEFCNNGKGSILGVSITNGAAPYTYNWVNASWQIFSTDLQFTNQHAGNYSLIVKDNNNCRDTSSGYGIQNVITTLPLPGYAAQTIRKGTSATLKVKNPSSGIYYLYESLNSTTAIAQNTTGIFTTPALDNDKTYFVQLKDGDCLSNRAAVPVTVVTKTDIYVPQAFTPNGDTKNDVLKPNVFGPVKLAYFSVYNHYGQRIYSTTALNAGWDGTYKGIAQPQAGYVWILKATDLLTNEVISMKGTVLLLR